MKPKPSPATTQPDLFQTELKSIINLSHPLVKLAEEFNWDEFEQQLQPTYAPVMGAPGINTRLMVALHFLKHQQDLSDEAVVSKWVENPYWQFFSGMQFFSHQPPIDSSSMNRCRVFAQGYHSSRTQTSGNQALRLVPGECGHNGSNQSDSVSNRCASLRQGA
jgi:IS5 family transposase